MAGRRVTLADVAREAGVSGATVSMVIHDSSTIPQKTKERIRAIIRRMGYIPNQAARSLAGGKTGRIALVSSTFYHYYYTEILRRFEEADTGYSFQLYATGLEGRKDEEVFRQILYGQGVDGVISLNRPLSPSLLKAYQDEGFPLVSLELPQEGIASVLCDNYRGGVLAAEYLCRQRSGRLLIVAGEDSWGRNATERIRGFQEAAGEREIGHVFRVQHADFSWGEGVFNKIVESGVSFDGIFCAAGDVVAAGLLSGAWKRGFQVPKDFSLIGYDGLELSAYTNPPLSTIRQPVELLCQEAFALLKRQIGREEAAFSKEILLSPELLIRDSV